MATLYTKVKKYLDANSKTYENERINIELQNDGSGDYIKTWNVSGGLAQPTDEQLATHSSSATTEENNHQIRKARKSAYGDIGEQLDEIYKDIDAWKTRIAKVKSDIPK